MSSKFTANTSIQRASLSDWQVHFFSSSLTYPLNGRAATCEKEAKSSSRIWINCPKAVSYELWKWAAFVIASCFVYEFVMKPERKVDILLRGISNWDIRVFCPATIFALTNNANKQYHTDHCIDVILENTAFYLRLFYPNYNFQF